MQAASARPVRRRQRGLIVGSDAMGSRRVEEHSWQQAQRTCQFKDPSQGSKLPAIVIRRAWLVLPHAAFLSDLT